MNPQEILDYILKQDPSLTKEQIQERISEAKSKTGGLISDAILLRMVAAEHGIKVPLTAPVKEHSLSISRLVSGLHDVTINGRVAAVYSVRTFEGENSGKYAGINLIDQEDMIRVVMWNEQADPIEKGELKTGDIVRLMHGYTKEDRSGKPELHLSRKSHIDINPPDLNKEDFPHSIAPYVTSIIDLSSEQTGVNLQGTAKQILSYSTFTRQDQTEGAVSRFILEDQTGTINVVLWNEKAQDAKENLTEDAHVQLFNGRVKLNNGQIEVHIDSFSAMNITKLNKIPPKPQNKSHPNQNKQKDKPKKETQTHL